MHEYKENNTRCPRAHDAMQLQERPDWAIIYRVNTTNKLKMQKRVGATIREFIQVF